ncbi:MAG: exo-alpha-sialidase, partial [Planctomycetes bacterium]|nr:exo-alpha-sialidase [Planctomycetota bacterium]
IFVDAGKPISVMGAATKDMFREEEALVIGPDESWGNPLFADLALKEKDFHIHARLTLDELGGSGASFLLGGFYHYPCTRPEGNETLRVSLDDETETYDRDRLGADARILYGMTKRRAPWDQADKEIAGKTADHIEPGQPFTLDLYQEEGEARFQINGNELFRIDLGTKERISGSSDGGWPICFGFLPDCAVIRLYDFWAEGRFAEMSLDHADVWSMGHDGYFTYRIPSLCLTPKGSLLAFAEARRSDFGRTWSWNQKWNPDEVHCVMKRSTDGGRTWSGQKLILGHGSSYEVRDPSPVADRETGNVFLITRGPYVMKSEDDGESWSDPRSLRPLLPDNLKTLSPGPGNSGIQIRNGQYAGRLMVAVAGDGNVGVMYSDDHGVNWTLGGMVEGFQGWEPQITELTGDRVLVNSRNHSDNPGRLISISDDGGTSFENYYDENLPAKGCEASLLRYNGTEKSGSETIKPAIFCGPDEGRRKLTVKFSLDDCKTWEISRMVYGGHSAYSAMAVLPDGEIGVLYEKDAYRRLSFARFDLDWLSDAEKE